MVPRGRGEGCPPTVAVGLRGALIAEAFGRVLNDADLHVTACYGTLQPLVDKVGRCRPDAIVVDALFGDPAAMLAALACAAPDSGLVVLADSVDGPLARAVVANGVRAVILKTSSVADTVAVLRQVLDGGTSFPGCVLERLSERHDTDGLSRRQLEVLEQLALGRSNEEIARELFISANTVKFHLRVIYDRLQVHNRVEAARLLAARRAG
jgi:DNA-binding NarL/FixJ family response regulator